MNLDSINEAYQTAMTGGFEPDCLTVPFVVLERAAVPRYLLRRLRRGKEVPASLVAPFVLKYFEDARGSCLKTAG